MCYYLYGRNELSACQTLTGNEPPSSLLPFSELVSRGLSWMLLLERTSGNLRVGTRRVSKNQVHSDTLVCLQRILRSLVVTNTPDR